MKKKRPGEEALVALLRSHESGVHRLDDITQKMVESGFSALSELDQAWLELVAATAALGTAAARWDEARKKYIRARKSSPPEG